MSQSLRLSQLFGRMMMGLDFGRVSSPSEVHSLTWIELTHPTSVWSHGLGMSPVSI